MTYFVQTLVYIRTVHILKLKLSTLKLRLAYLCGSGRNDSSILQNYAIVKNTNVLEENSAKSTSLELASSPLPDLSLANKARMANKTTFYPTSQSFYALCSR